ncbi:MAG: tetratricopeptide repeat protein, partial [Thermoplasmata archaeon]|nr:tetratricopeptide repeat protein [Thermoplasmata archaeon]
SKAVAHRGLGYVHWREGLFDKAIQHYKKCIVSAKKTGDKRILGEINIEMGNATSGKGDLSGAAEHYKEAIRLLEATEHYSELSRAYNNLGDISLQRQEWDEAIQYFQKCGKAAEKIGYKNMLAWALFNMAEAQAKKGELVPALEKTEKAVIMLRKLGDQNGLSGAEKNLGIIYRFMKDWDRSREHFEIAVRLQEEMNNPQPLAETYIEYGAMNVDKGDPDRARSLMQKAIDISVQIQAKEFEKRARKLMKRIGGSH